MHLNLILCQFILPRTALTVSCCMEREDTTASPSCRLPKPEKPAVWMPLLPPLHFALVFIEIRTPERSGRLPLMSSGQGAAVALSASLPPEVEMLSAIRSAIY
jgi:hypothetical protein